MGGGGGTKIILAKSEGLRPSEVGGGRVLAAEGDNKPIKGNGGAVFFVSERVGMAEFDNGIGNINSSWY